MTVIHQKAIDLIVREEVSSEKAYRSKYIHTEWPGGASGVTVGIGYDLGYSSAAKIAKDWSPYLPADVVSAMQEAALVHGPNAQGLSAKLHSRITVPWEAAIAEFKDVELPQWDNKVRKVLPNYDKLSSLCRGVLVSLAYNRGVSFSLEGSRFTEMRAIRQHMISENFDKISGEFRAMKRLWPNMVGLRNRRDHEAALFDEGLGLAPEAKPDLANKPDVKPIPELPDQEQNEPEPKKDISFWGKARNWLGTTAGIGGGFAFDWKMGVAVVVGVLIVLGVVIWIVGRDDIKAWLKRHFA